MEIIRKINLFSDGFYFVCCFPLLLFFKINIRHYYVIFSTLFMFYVSFTQMLRQHCRRLFPFLLHNSRSVPHCYRLSARTKEKFSWWYRFAWERNKQKTWRKSLLKFFQSLKFFYFLWGGLCEFVNVQTGAEQKIWFCGGNPINWLDRTLKNHTLL